MLCRGGGGAYTQDVRYPAGRIFIHSVHMMRWGFGSQGTLEARFSLTSAGLYRMSHTNFHEKAHSVKADMAALDRGRAQRLLVLRAMLPSSLRAISFSSGPQCVPKGRPRSCSRECWPPSKARRSSAHSRRRRREADGRCAVRSSRGRRSLPALHGRDRRWSSTFPISDGDSDRRSSQ